MGEECLPGWFGRRTHNFEGRYDLSAPRITKMETSGYSSSEAMCEFLDAMKAKTYIYDICTRCGKRQRRKDAGI